MAPTLRALLLLFLLCASHLCSKVHSAAIVTHLPGFPGPLPFYLETGYVTVDEHNGAELFYYFIESERIPAEDPVLLWLTGGPRCSGFSGLVLEIGPLNFMMARYNGSIPGLVYHPYSWTKVASIIFLDSPVGSGFSFSPNAKGYDVGDVSSSIQVHRFLLKWFVDHPQYLSNPFYVAGDSYAGKVAPFIVHLIVEGIEDGQQPGLNLKGYLLGNPSTGAKVDKNSRVPYAHGVGLISDQFYEVIMRNCEGEDIENPITQLCSNLVDEFNKIIAEVYKPHILEPKCDGGFIDKILEPKCVGGVPNVLGPKPRRSAMGCLDLQQPPTEPSLNCRSYAEFLSYYWANNNTTREALQIKQGTIMEWVRCQQGLSYARDLTGVIKYHLNLTSRGYRALIYSGDHDLVVPFLGTQEWIRSLNFSVVDDWRAWHVEQQAAGFTLTYSNNMTFATVKGGGHTAPQYKPKECLAMVQRWLSHEPL